MTKWQMSHSPWDKQPPKKNKSSVNLTTGPALNRVTVRLDESAFPDSFT